MFLKVWRWRFGGALPCATMARAADQEAQKPRRYRISVRPNSYRQYLPRGEQSAPETLFDFHRSMRPLGLRRDGN